MDTPTPEDLEAMLRADAEHERARLEKERAHLQATVLGLWVGRVAFVLVSALGLGLIAWAAVAVWASVLS